MNFLIDNVWVIATALLSGGALLWPSIAARGSKVSLLQATRMFNDGKAVFVDVRDPQDFSEGHVRDSRNLPLREFKQRITELDKYKGRPVIVVCATGVRSAQAQSLLRKAGFTETYSLIGGLSAWQAQGLPVTK